MQLLEVLISGNSSVIKCSRNYFQVEYLWSTGTKIKNVLGTGGKKKERMTEKVMAK